MWTKKQSSADIERRDYQRETFRASVISLFANVFAYRKKHSGFTLTALAEKVGIHKSAPSRWFSGEHPNLEENTMADIADGMDVELEIYARDRKTGMRFAPYGPVTAPSYQVEAKTTREHTSFNWKGHFVQGEAPKQRAVAH